MGGMMGFLDKLPGMSNSGIQQAIEQANPEKQVKKMEAIIQSMTPKERKIQILSIQAVKTYCGWLWYGCF